MPNHLKSLQQVGLNKNQAKTYLANLELGPSTIISLAKKTGISRTTIYDYIRILKDYGLITEIIEQGKKMFMAEHPNKLSNILESKRQAIDESLPGLTQIFDSTKTKPKIQFFHGIEGIVKILELSTLDNKEKVKYIFGNLNTLFSWIPEPQTRCYGEIRVKKGIRNYIIAANTLEEIEKFSVHDHARHKKELREIRLAPKDMNFSFQFYCYDDNIALISSTKEGYSILIKSQEFSDALKSLFKFIWSLSLPVN